MKVTKLDAKTWSATSEPGEDSSARGFLHAICEHEIAVKLTERHIADKAKAARAGVYDSVRLRRLMMLQAQADVAAARAEANADYFLNLARALRHGR